jgi:hypothetical protein
MIDEKHPFEKGGIFRIIEGTVSASEVLEQMMAQADQMYDQTYGLYPGSN